MKDRKKKEQKEKEEYASCDIIEGCRTVDVVDMPANKKVMDMTRDFINSVFGDDKKNSSDDSNS